MQISGRFTIAVHIFLCIHNFRDEYKITSDFLASSINVNPVIIRRLLGQLRDSGLVSVQRGSGGADLAKPANEITLLDIFNAVESLENRTLFHFHKNPNIECPVGRNIHAVLDGRLEQIQAAMEHEMRSITLEDLFNDLQNELKKKS